MHENGSEPLLQGSGEILRKSVPHRVLFSRLDRPPMLLDQNPQFRMLIFGRLVPFEECLHLGGA
jgi:hypothetical protein